MNMETLNEYIRRTTFMDWKSSEAMFVPHPQVAEKIDADGRCKPFWGDTTLFYLAEDAAKALTAAQSRLYESGIPLAEKLNPSQFHMTLHDLDHTLGCDQRWDETRRRAENAIAVLEDGEVCMIPVRAFPMMNTSIVVGYRPAEEKDCRLLMAWHQAFDPIFAYGRPSFHVTLAYFRPGEEGQMETEDLRRALDAVNQLPLPELRLTKEQLVYQRFYDMNCYF